MGHAGDDHRGFQLTRHFSLVALLTILIAAVALGEVYRHFAKQHLIQSEERHNAELAQYFAAMLWPDYGAFLTSRQDQSADSIRRHPRSQQLHATVLRLLSGSHVLKIKFFDGNGLTVYSSDRAQIGEDKSQYRGFLAASRGEIRSELSFRDRFYAHADEAELLNREMLSSYVPLRDGNGNDAGVMELYKDVTPLLEDIEQIHLQLVLATVVVMLCLYSALFLIVKRADRIIREKSQAQRDNERQIQHQANHDALTGLPNRRYFRQLLGERMAGAEKQEHLIALLFIDLDRFKPVNDSFGHQVGDELLKVVAQRLRATCRDSDIVCRIAGDEFTLILDRLDHVRSIERAALRIIDALSQSIYIDDKELAVGASIGIAVYPFDDQDLDELIKHADTAMYHAKQSGRNCFRFYAEEMNVQALQRMDMERDLRQGLRDQQFELFYQPRVDLQRQQVVAVEALLRWHHPEKGLVTPDQFIPIAEESGLILPIGHWVLQEACRQILQLGDANLGVSVNVSARQFESTDFINEVTQVLQTSGLSPQRLELELTETMLMRSCEECIVALDGIKRTGIRLSLDDFGTGYSSLSYLKRLPLDVLKIDRSFLANVTENPRNAALASTIATLGRKLDMQVVAEGVETEAQLAFVKGCGCHEVQGYLIARPMPLQQLQRFLHDQTARRRTG
jgi:diguanylate cyclase (GGDEF)-like protein